MSIHKQTVDGICIWGCDCVRFVEDEARTTTYKREPRGKAKETP